MTIWHFLSILCFWLGCLLLFFLLICPMGCSSPNAPSFAKAKAYYDSVFATTDTIKISDSSISNQARWLLKEDHEFFLQIGDTQENGGNLPRYAREYVFHYVSFIQLEAEKFFPYSAYPDSVFEDTLITLDDNKTIVLR